MQYFMELIHNNQLLAVIYAIGLVIIGYYLAKQLSRLTEKTLETRLSRHHTLLMKRFVFYLIIAIFLIGGLQHLGFQLSVLLGAAGVFTVAISFASQTAISNLISGIFLLFERPFKIGDLIEVNKINGTVDSIDLFSTKIKTADNTLIRIPNQTLMKSSISNLSSFATRRITILLGIDYDSNLEQIKTALLGCINECPAILKNPPPSINIENFENYAIQLSLMVWVKTADAANIRSELQDSIKQHFDEIGIKGLRPIMIYAPINNSEKDKS